MEIATIRRAPVAPALNAADLVWLIGQFVIDRRAKLDNQLTVDVYEHRLRWFIDWWNSRGPTQQWRLQTTDLVDFERHLREEISALTKRPLSWSYRTSIIYIMREVFHWAADKGYTQHNYASWVPSAHGHKPRRKVAGITAFIHLLIEAGKSKQYTRDRAMIAMLIGMGLRRAEVSKMNVEDAIFRADLSGHAHVSGKRTKANPTGEREAAFDSATGKIIAEHIDAKGYAHGPLFRNNGTDQRLTPAGVHQAVKLIIRRAGLEHQIQACHDLRRGFATYYARTKPGADSADLRRRQLGHAHYSQTTEYTFYDVDDIRQDMVSAVSLLQDNDSAQHCIKR